MIAFPGHNHQSESLCSIPYPYDIRVVKIQCIYKLYSDTLHRLAENTSMTEILLDILHHTGYIWTISEKMIFHLTLVRGRGMDRNDYRKHLFYQASSLPYLLCQPPHLLLPYQKRIYYNRPGFIERGIKP